jgi:hypothetical protein
MQEDFNLDTYLKLFCDFLRDTGYRSYNAKTIPLTRKFNAWLKEKHPELSFVPSFDMEFIFKAWGGQYWDGSLWFPEECVCTRCGGTLKNDVCTRCHFNQRDAPVKADPDTANLAEFLGDH